MEVGFIGLTVAAFGIYLPGGSHGGGGGHFNYGSRRQKRTQEILEELADNVLKKYGEEGDE